MKKLLCLSLLGAASMVASSKGALAGDWCWRDNSQSSAPQTYFRHEYPRYTAPTAGVVDVVPGPGPANYASTGVPYYYAGGFAPGGFVPNYEYSGGVGGFRIDVFAPR